MAAVKTNETTKLVLSVETGTTAGGAPVYGQRSFANIRPSLSDDDVLTLGTGLAALQTHPLGKVVRQDTAVLVEE